MGNGKFGKLLDGAPGGLGELHHALLGGQVDLLCDQTTQTVQHIRAGTVKIYGVTTPKRLSVLADVAGITYRGPSGPVRTADRDRIAEVEALIREKPDNPYFVEVKGDILMRAGKVRESIQPLRQALKMLPDAPLIRVQLASALQNEDTPQNIAESVELLRKSLIEDANSRAFRLLANAYYKQGKLPEADAATAQALFVEGDLKQAQIFAKRAQVKLQPGTPDWVKNDDILNYKPQT